MGDRAWPHTLSLKHVIHPWFPAPLLALRTLKGEIALGLSEGQAEAVRTLHKDWMVTGQFAVVQYVSKQQSAETANDVR